MAIISREKFCRICSMKLQLKHDWNLIVGRTCNLQNEIEDLPFEVESSTRDSRYACHVCRDLLLRRKSFRDKILDVETKLRSKFSPSSIEIMVPSTTSFAPSLTSTPTGHPPSKRLAMGSDDASKCLVRNVTKPCSDEVHENPQRKISKSAKSIRFGGNGQTQVTVRVNWTSKAKERKLPCDLASLGKMLCGRFSFFPPPLRLPPHRQ